MPRRYRSSLRDSQARRTRRRVLDAATKVFLDRGYGAATVRAIAAEAGVSVPTVEAAFGTKARLLKAAIDVAIAGDDEAVPVLDRGWAAEARAATTADEFLSVVSGVLAAAQSRSAGLVLAAFEASATDPQLDQVAQEMVAQRAITAAWVVEGLGRLARLREVPVEGEAVDTVWLLMDPAVFDRLTRQRRWTPDRYAGWFAGAVRRLLMAEPVMAPDHRSADIQAQLSVRRGRVAVDFYKTAFGAAEQFRFGGDDTDEGVVAQLAVGNGSFWVEDEAPDHHFSPESLGGSTGRMLLIVDDPHGALEKAEGEGATVIDRVTEEHGWLLGRIVDPFGHHWEIGKPLVEWPADPVAAETTNR